MGTPGGSLLSIISTNDILKAFSWHSVSETFVLNLPRPVGVLPNARLMVCFLKFFQKARLMQISQKYNGTLV